MPKEVSKYPPGSYGAYLDQQAYLLQEKVRAIQEMEANPKYIAKDMRQLQHDAGKALVSLSLAQERIKRGGRNLTDQHPKDAWWQNLEDESDRTAFPREKAGQRLSAKIADD